MDFSVVVAVLAVEYSSSLCSSEVDIVWAVVAVWMGASWAEAARRLLDRLVIFVAWDKSIPLHSAKHESRVWLHPR